MSHKTQFPITRVFPFGYTETRPGANHQTVFPFRQYGLTVQPLTGDFDIPTWNFPFYRGSLVSETGDMELVTSPGADPPTILYGPFGAAFSRTNGTDYTYGQGSGESIGSIVGMSLYGYLPFNTEGGFGAGLVVGGTEVVRFHLHCDQFDYVQPILDVVVGGYNADYYVSTSLRAIPLHVVFLVDMTAGQAFFYVNGSYVWSGGPGTSQTGWIGSTATPFVIGAKTSMDEVVFFANMSKVADWQDFEALDTALYASGRPYFYRNAVGWIQPAATVDVVDSGGVSHVLPFVSVAGGILNGLFWSNGIEGDGLRAVFLAGDSTYHPMCSLYEGNPAVLTKTKSAGGVVGSYELPYPADGDWVPIP